MNLLTQRSHIPLVRNEKPKKVKEKKRARTKIKPVSKRRAKLNREYSKLREKFLLHNPYCQWSMEVLGKPVPATEIHHKKRRGKYFLDTSTWMSVSKQAHLAIHADPKTSYEKGWMQPR